MCLDPMRSTPYRCLRPTRTAEHMRALTPSVQQPAHHGRYMSCHSLASPACPPCLAAANKAHTGGCPHHSLKRLECNATLVWQVACTHAACGALLSAHGGCADNNLTLATQDWGTGQQHWQCVPTSSLSFLHSGWPVTCMVL